MITHRQSEEVMRRRKGTERRVDGLGMRREGSRLLGCCVMWSWRYTLLILATGGLSASLFEARTVVTSGLLGLGFLSSLHVLKSKIN